MYQACAIKKRFQQEDIHFNRLKCGPGIMPVYKIMCTKKNKEKIMQCPNCGRKGYGILSVAKEVDKKVFKCKDCGARLKMDVSIIRVVGIAVAIGIIAGGVIGLINAYVPGVRIPVGVAGAIVGGLGVLVNNLLMKLKVVKPGDKK